MILPQTGVEKLIRAVEAARLKDLKSMAQINGGAGILCVVIRTSSTFFCICQLYCMVCGTANIVNIYFITKIYGSDFWYIRSGNSTNYIFKFILKLGYKDVL